MIAIQQGSTLYLDYCSNIIERTPACRQAGLANGGGTGEINLGGL